MDHVTCFALLAEARKYRAGGCGPKATLLAIIERMGETDGEWTCWPSMATVAYDAEQDVRTVRRHVAAFEADGLIERRVQGKAGGGRATNLLVLNVPALFAGKPVTVSGGEPGQSGEPNRSPDTEQTGHSPILHLSMEEPVEEPRERARANFDDFFWPAYPPRSGKKLERAKALDEFVRLSLEDQRAAFRGAKNLAAGVAAGGAFGVRNAHRFLRLREWEDWQEPAVVSSRGSTAGNGHASPLDLARTMYAKYRDEELADAEK